MSNTTDMNHTHALVRTFSPGKLATLRILMFRVFAWISPGMAVRKAEEMFCTPPRGSSTSAERAILEDGEPFSLTVMGSRMQGWCWGEGPLVYLVHGWGRHCLSFAQFVNTFSRHGYRVVAFDAPGHGMSEGTVSSGLHISAALQAAVEHIGPAQGIVAHSIGATSTAFAIRKGLPVARLVFLGAADDPVAYERQFLTAIGLPSKLCPAVEQNLEKRFHFHWPDLKVSRYASQMTVPLLVIHDLNDATVSWTDGAAIAGAWPNARLIKTKGLGHRGLLRDEKVIGYAKAFISESGDLPDDPYTT